MREIVIIAILLAFPFFATRRVFDWIWEKFKLYRPKAVEDFDILLRKRWPMIQTRHLFIFSFILINLVTFLFLFGSLFNLATIPLPLGIMLGIMAPFLVVYILKPNIEASFLFEVRNVYMMLRTQVYAGATPKEALAVVAEIPGILQQDLQKILLAWGGNIEPVLQEISNKYCTEELDLLLSLIREINLAGASNQKEVIQSFDSMKEMMETEIAAKEAMNDEKEMEWLEMSSFVVVLALFFLMVFPMVGDIINQFENIEAQ